MAVAFGPSGADRETGRRSRKGAGAASGPKRVFFAWLRYRGEQEERVGGTPTDVLNRFRALSARVEGTSEGIDGGKWADWYSVPCPVSAAAMDVLRRRLAAVGVKCGPYAGEDCPYWGFFGRELQAFGRGADVARQKRQSAFRARVREATAGGNPALLMAQLFHEPLKALAELSQLPPMDDEIPAGWLKTDEDWFTLCGQWPLFSRVYGWIAYQCARAMENPGAPVDYATSAGGIAEALVRVSEKDSPLTYWQLRSALLGEWIAARLPEKERPERKGQAPRELLPPDWQEIGAAGELSRADDRRRERQSFLPRWVREWSPGRNPVVASIRRHLRRRR